MSSYNVIEYLHGQSIVIAGPLPYAAALDAAADAADRHRAADPRDRPLYTLAIHKPGTAA